MREMDGIRLHPAVQQNCWMYKIHLQQPVQMYSSIRITEVMPKNGNLLWEEKGIQIVSVLGNVVDVKMHLENQVQMFRYGAKILQMHSSGGDIYSNKTE